MNVRRTALGIVLAVAACAVTPTRAPPKPEPIEEGPATTYMTTSLSGSVTVTVTVTGSGSGSPIPTSGLVDLSPSRFDGVDICLRDTYGDLNSCARTYGVSNGMGGIERPCALEARAVLALIEARRALKKVNPDLELLITSSYRPPEHQQCLWLDGSDGKKCLSTVCGARDGKGKPLPCKKYDLASPIWAHVFDHCKHVDMRAIDVCAYDKAKAKLDAHGVIDMPHVADCQIKSGKAPAGMFFHPCGCRSVGWTKDMRDGSKRAKALFKNGGVDEQQAMTKALRGAGFVDDVSNEWWHFHFPKP